ncbi:inducible mutagenesis protein ImuA 2 [Pseudorhizobium endolithicum]|uniref:Inducible mutagenesis protein ImuA 2 n=1 Tax=Pseudorhizobium endolithicum TaxID=1191678 RepID=A0ABM8PKQ2_9HYPH|nr:ImuA family protein [Pseudorhizobium endolithicum]CAD6436564.1 damage-inducible mutagenesis protein [Rhizobium sp. Q54]CAD7035293.1 inducible mutagenesis protein ImuA 2 [Pseudorhizobium endolithicum]
MTIAAASSNTVLNELREKIASLEGTGSRIRTVLPFGVGEIDARLPGGGLAYGALHEVAGGGNGAIDGAAAALFIGGIAARTTGKVIWCLTRFDLFFPALAQVGLHPDRVIFVECDKEETVLASFEEALRYGGLGAVVAELVRLPMTASRRLQLAAEQSGTMGLVIRRWRRQTEASDFGMPTAAATRWRISVLPSEPLPVPGVGRARWLAELMRVRAGEGGEFIIGACDGKGRICLSSDTADRQDQASRSFALS